MARVESFDLDHNIVNSPFVTGFLEGYLTMDTIAALNFGIVIAIAIKTKGVKEEKAVETVKNAVKSYPELKGAILHSDRGSQYTSEKYREALKHAGFVQSMNSAGGRCHDNARCESMWARMKEELFYSRNRMRYRWMF